VIVARSYASTTYVVMWCPSICHVREFCQNQYIYLQFSSPSGSQTVLVSPHQMLQQYSNGDTPNRSVQCRWDRHKSRFWANSWLSIDDCYSARSTFEGRRCSSVSHVRCTSVYGTETATHQWIRRREQNLFVRSGKSEAEVA